MNKNNLNVILDGMNILNQIAEKYPDAISFASGRPNEKFYDISTWGGYASRFSEHYQKQFGVTNVRALGLLGQYGATNGIINDLISEMLTKDEGIFTKADSIMITCGAQEAMVLCLLVLCRKPEDIMMVCDPTYVGMTGAAIVTRTNICSIGMDSCGPRIDQITSAIHESKMNGLRVRALYTIPNFDNPSGIVTSLDRRKELIHLCAQEDIYIIEDNPYGMFRYEGLSVPNLKSLDRSGGVIYIGSFAKTISPSLRIGFLALPDNRVLIQEFSQVKSFVTLNTSQYNQAVVGGYLLANSASLSQVLTPAVDYYRNNRNLITESLNRHFGRRSDCISWSIPDGGFFVMLKLPIEFSVEDMDLCACRYKVIVVPVSCLSVSDIWIHYVRLSFSYIVPEDIDRGVERFRSYIDSRLNAA